MKTRHRWTACLGLVVAASYAFGQANGFPGYGDPNAGQGYPGYGDKNKAKGFPSWGSGVRYIQGTSQSTVWRTYSDGALSRIEQPLTRVIRGEAEWDRYWKLHKGDARAVAPKDIDWSREQLVAIHLGTRSTSGYSVMVESVAWPKPNEVLVKYVERTPSPDSMVAQVLTSPFTIIRMQRGSGTVVFQKRTVRQ